MGYPESLQQKRRNCLLNCMALTLAIFLLSSMAAAQVTNTPAPENPVADELNKYPGLLPEFGRLMQKLQAGIQYPPGRTQSRLLPLLLPSTVFYAAFPNFGEPSHQALIIFQKELQESPVLRAWWKHTTSATTGPKVEESLEKFYQLSQYLGDEMVVSGGTTADHKDPELLILAEIRKPGLKDFLQQLSKEFDVKSPPAVRVLDAQELAALKEPSPSKQLLILVLPNVVVAALDLTTLRSFKSQLERNSTDFVSAGFGQRLAQAYGGSAIAVGGVDLQKIVSELPRGTDQNEMLFQRSGFSDAKYLIWEHRDVDNQAASQMELSFTGPRRGVASWLAAPGRMGSLDFVSPKAVMAGAVLLKNPAQIFDDVTDLTASLNPKALASIAQMEAVMKLSLKDDLLSHLGGEITFELDSFTPPDPQWRVILRVTDPNRLQATVSKLLGQTPLRPQESEEEGVTYYTIRIPSAKKMEEIGYAFVDGYLVIGSGRESVVEAIRLHRNGEALAKSKKFLAALPPGHTADASALFYEDPAAMMALSMGQALPDMTKLLLQEASASSPIVGCTYGEETSIREVSRSRSVDPSAMLIMAAIAIPNLLRARIAANESSAVTMIRTGNVAQISYSTTYPERGFARDLATLGPDPRNAKAYSAAHAGLIDDTLGNASCTAGAWCTKSGFRFSISTSCKKQRCDEYVVVATPVSTSTGIRSFCSTSDAVIRYKGNTLLTSPLSVSECRGWSPLQ